MSRIWTNSRGNMFQSGIGGTYPVNNGDPQCDVEFDDNENESQATGAPPLSLNAKSGASGAE
jgi:hypothetical protein